MFNQFLSLLLYSFVQINWFCTLVVLILRMTLCTINYVNLASVLKSMVYLQSLTSIDSIHRICNLLNWITFKIRCFPSATLSSSVAVFYRFCIWSMTKPVPISIRSTFHQESWNGTRSRRTSRSSSSARFAKSNTVTTFLILKKSKT